MSANDVPRICLAPATSSACPSSSAAMRCTDPMKAPRPPPTMPARRRRVGWAFPTSLIAHASQAAQAILYLSASKNDPAPCAMGLYGNATSAQACRLQEMAGAEDVQQAGGPLCRARRSAIPGGLGLRHIPGLLSEDKRTNCVTK